MASNKAFIDATLVTSEASQIPDWWEGLRSDLPLVNLYQRQASAQEEYQAPLALIQIPGYAEKTLYGPFTEDEFTEALDSYVNMFMGLSPVRRFLIRRRAIAIGIGVGILALIVVLLIIVLRSK